MKNKMDLAISRDKIFNERSLLGSTSDKYPVVLNDGRTVIYISDKSKEAEIRLKYECLKDQKYPTRCPRHY